MIDITATGGERDEQVALAIRGMDHIARHNGDPAVRVDSAQARDVLVALAASAAAGQALLNNHRCDEAAEGSYRRAIAADSEVARLTTLLTEQTATIERARAVAATLMPLDQRNMLDALGPQRTEGQ